MIPIIQTKQSENNRIIVIAKALNYTITFPKSKLKRAITNM
jgi:hypothetical protein